MFIARHRWVPLLGAAILLAGCGASTSDSSTSPNPSPPSGAVHVSLLDYSITPATISVPAGTFSIYVTNDGKTPHNFTIRSPRGPAGPSSKIVAHSKDLNPGQADIITATLPAGDYKFYCAFAGHEQLGMIGDYTVT